MKLIAREKLQQLVYELIGGLKGGIAVMDARTGEILSLCSSPSFDPNIFIDKNMNGAVKKVMQDIDSPLLNRVVNAYPPGSIFKVVTAYAGLAEKNINPESAIFCPGKFKIGDSVRFCWLKRGHKEVFLKTALAGSCNVYFWEIGLKIGEKILSKYAKEFSLGKLTGIELPGESAGVVPDSKWKSLQLHQRWYGGDTINFSIGQGYLLVSPIQALRMIAFVANEGYEVSPHILKKQAAIKNKKVLNPDFFDIIKQGMYEVVNSPFGTGYNAFIENARIFAKTGTAQVFGQIPHAWFAGFVEIKDRKICFIVFLENGGHGGESAALIAKQIVAYFNNNN
ncbi:MAG: hypothetical protein HY810_02030 [Candidatus Omnitrophica bacterium]|nr:hypothetical protein [Candidatus Omnitrophota bacterium]